MHAGLPAGVDRDDLTGSGLFGLIDAIERFDPERGVKFETYAAPRIRGAIVDELRTIDWAPRSVRSKARAIEQAQHRLEASLHRAPTDDELADELDIEVVDLKRALRKIRAAGIAELDEPVADRDGDTVTRGEMLPAAPPSIDVVDVDRMKRTLAAAVARLPQREKLVLALLYFEQLPLGEIGERLNVTLSRVSQIHTKAIKAIRLAQLTAPGAG